MKSLLILSLVLATACASVPRPTENANAGAAGESFPVIDVHTHTRFDGRPEMTSKIVVTREQYLKERKETGVVASISHVSEDGAGYNADMKAENVFHCFGIGKKVDLAKLERGLKSRDYRCVKIYLGYIHRFASEEPYRGVYKIAQKYDVPVVFHTGDTYSTEAKLKYSHPLTIDDVAVDFPKVTFVIAHLGNPWVKSAAEVAYKNPNVYVEGSAFLIGDLSKTDEKTIDELMVEPLRWANTYMESGEKMMYGTDWPLVGMKPYFEAYKRAFPRDQWCRVFFDNAVKVFRLKEIGERYKCTVK